MQSYDVNRCPVCKRVHEVTPTDDVLLPACGCFGRDLESVDAAPCEACGFAHIMRCDHFTAGTRRVVHAVMEGAPIVTLDPATGVETRRTL